MGFKCCSLPDLQEAHTDLDRARSRDAMALDLALARQKKALKELKKVGAFPARLLLFFLKTAASLVLTLNALIKA